MPAKLTKEQRDVLEVVARWIWWGSQAANRNESERQFKYWGRRVQSAAVRWLNANCDDMRGMVKPATLRRMLDSLPSPSTETDR